MDVQRELKHTNIPELSALPQTSHRVTRNGDGRPRGTGGEPRLLQTCVGRGFGFCAAAPMNGKCGYNYFRFLLKPPAPWCYMSGL